MGASILGAFLGLGAIIFGLGGLAVYFWRESVRARTAARHARTRAETANRRLMRAPVGAFVFEAAGNGGEGWATGRLRYMLDLPEGRFAVDALVGRFEAGPAARLADICTDPSRAAGENGLIVGPSIHARWFAVYAVPQDEAFSDPAILWFADVTEEVQRRHRYAAEAERLDSVVDGFPLQVWFRDSALAVTSGNTAYAQAVGLTRDEVRRQQPELLGNSVRDAGLALAGRARERGALATERHHVVIEGSRRLMEIMELPQEGGGTVGLAIDRTQEEELEGRLSRHISAHADVLESLSTAIVVFAPDLRVRFYNRAYQDLWSLDSALLNSEPHFTEILDTLRAKRVLPEQPDFPAYKRESVEKLRNLVETEEELIHRPDERTFKLTRVPHPFGGVLMTYEDVTDRLTLERNFNTMLDVQRETIENLHEAVAVYGPDGRLKLYNQVFLNLWDLDVGQLGAHPHVRDVVEAARRHFPVRDAYWRGLREHIVARATETESRAGRIELADRTVLDWAQVPLPDGQSLFTYLDVSDSIRVERALRDRAEALETADQLKSEFIANISYELRTPLNAISGFAEMLETEYYGDLNSRQKEYARSIATSSQRLTALINDILDLASIEAGYMILEQETLRMGDLLNNLRSITSERARQRGLTLDIECPDPDVTFTGDARRLRQAIYNLISNAFNFTEDGGRVTLRGERVRDEVHISVTDTGVGIPQQDQDRMFLKFERGDTRNGGPGLGLSLVSSLIQLHGGRILLESQPNLGTRVTCALPVMPAASDGADIGAAALPTASQDNAA